MPVIPITTPTLAAVVAAPTAASGGGDTAINPRGNLVLRLANSAGAPVTVTIPAGVMSPRKSDNNYPQMAVPPVVVSIPAGGAVYVGPFPYAFNDANAALDLAYSDAAHTTVEAIQV
jgi:hypothetical protein